MTDILHSNLLSQLDWIEHGFGTRQAKLSQNGMASLKQIHSALSLIVADRRTGCVGASGCVGEGDALITDAPGTAVSIRTADCFPILLADNQRHVVAAVHAGWRGTAGRIVAGTLARMHDEFGTEARDVYAAIGPGIGACCYEVGADVARLFGLEHAGKLDLAEANRRQMLESGVPEAHIEMMRRCTFCDAEWFHSYRRDKDTAGRMVSYVRALTGSSEDSSRR